ncbi:TPA: hypothetical protein ACFU2Q_000247 [Neisseria subflava]|jgi:hypothetical protein
MARINWNKGSFWVGVISIIVAIIIAVFPYLNSKTTEKISPESSARNLRIAVDSKRRNAQFNCIPADRKNLSANWLKAEGKYEDGKRNMMNKKYEMATQDFREAFNLYDDLCIEFKQSK